MCYCKHRRLRNSHQNGGNFMLVITELEKAKALLLLVCYGENRPVLRYEQEIEDLLDLDGGINGGVLDEDLTKAERLLACI